MQVASQATPEKQNILEKAQSSKIAPVSQPTASAVKSTATNKTENNETSQYLKVLSRIESLLVQEKLPEAAIQGFVGAVKKQLDILSEADQQIVMNLPEMKALKLDHLDELPEMIKENLADKSKSSELLQLLRLPKFASLMKTDSKPAAQTYTAQVATPVAKSATAQTVEPPSVAATQVTAAVAKPVVAQKPA